MSKERIAIVHGRVIDPAQNLDALTSIYLADGKVVGLGRSPDGFQPDRLVDASNRVVCPGLVDLCARLREPGLEHKASIASETAAAVAGGITTLVCPPDTDPVLDTPAVARLIRGRAERAGYARVEVSGALTRGLQGQELSEMAALRDAGCLAVSNAQRPVISTLVLRRAMEYAAQCGLPMVIRPNDFSLSGVGCAHEGAVSTRLGLPAVPVSAETVALAQALALMEGSGVRIHFGQLSSAGAVSMIAAAKARGQMVSADVAAHQLHLTEDAVAGFDANAHVLPPLRSQADMQALRVGLAEGVIDAICSDHQPHELDAKLDAFPATEPGISALETLLSLSLALVAEGVLPVSTAVARLTSFPARILGLPAGTLAVGAAADLCIFDPQLTWTLASGSWRSQGHNTPFWGQTLRGRVVETLRGGVSVFRLDQARS